MVNKMKTIPRGWEIKKIADLLDYERPDKYIVKSTIYSDRNKIPVLTANKSFVLGYTNEDFCVYENVPVIIFDDFTTDSKFVGFPFKIKSSAIKILKAKNKNVNLRFVFEKMKSINFSVGNHKRYYISQYREQEVATPPINEQNKIAEILSSVDEEIEKVDQEIKKTEELKRGLMKDFFTKGIGHKKFKKTRLGGIPEEWEVVKFNKYVKFIYGAGLIKNKRIHGNYPVYGSNGIVGYHNEFLVKGPGVIIGRKGTIGAINWSEVSFWPIDTTYYVEADNKKINLRWFFYKLQNLKLDKMNSATGVPGLNRENVYNLYISIPNVSEQEKIAKIIFDVDSKIDVNKQIRNKLFGLKKGLTQDLLSGRISYMNQNIKNELAKRAIVRAQSGLYFLQDIVLPHIRRGTDAAYSRSAYVLLSYNTELILSALFILGCEKTTETEIINDLILASKSHNYQNIFSKITDKFRFGIQSIIRNEKDGFVRYDIKINNSVINVEDFIDVRYDFKKNNLRHMNPDEGADLRNSITLLLNLVKSIIDKSIKFGNL